ncbi:MAG TPA: STAS domain-containing protein [Anaerolineales bacterium]|nr:STAS domain-containing protein [Anaerolineales bacterium]
MDISVSQKQGNVPITVIKLDGELDGQNYQELISKARELFSAGARDFVLDLSDLTYISSAGLVALHSVALLVKGEELPDTEQGWSAYRSMGRTSASGVQTHIKLLNPREEIRNVLDMVGFGNVFQVYTDLDEAVQSF